MFKPTNNVNERHESTIEILTREFKTNHETAMLDVASSVSHCAYRLIELENGSSAALAIWNSNARDKVTYVHSALWRCAYLFMDSGLIGYRESRLK